MLHVYSQPFLTTYCGDDSHVDNKMIIVPMAQVVFYMQVLRYLSSTSPPAISSCSLPDSRDTSLSTRCSGLFWNEAIDIWRRGSKHDELEQRSSNLLSYSGVCANEQQLDCVSDLGRGWARRLIF